MFKIFRSRFMDVAWYLIVFLLIQAAVTVVVTLFYKEKTTTTALPLVIIAVASSLLTIALFTWRHWFFMSRDYLRSHPASTLVWVIILSFGTIIPSEWLLEMLGLEMSAEEERIFTLLMSRPEGYFAVGILVPLAEEMVFRGAILRTLLRAPLSARLPVNVSTWLSIVLSALLFGAAHGNMPQFVHASLLGILLGWMYWRTGSIVPGLVLHWANNSIAYAVCRLMPGLENGNLIDLLQGDERRVLLYVAFSLMVLVPSLYQLHLRMKRPSAARL